MIFKRIINLWNKIFSLYNKSLLGRTLYAFSLHGGYDQAAGLTYYLVISIFPLMIVLVAMLSMIGAGQGFNTVILPTVEKMVPQNALYIIEQPLHSIASFGVGYAGIAIITSFATMLWSASNYTAGFARALHKIFEAQHDYTNVTTIGFRLKSLLATLVILILLVLLTYFSLYSDIVSTWFKQFVPHIPILLPQFNGTRIALMILGAYSLLIILYKIIPNMMTWSLSARKSPFLPGASAAIAGIALITWLLRLYLNNFNNYERVYGALTGIIIFLLWFWLCNTCMLIGAELNHQLALRSFELQQKRFMSLIVKGEKSLLQASQKQVENLYQARKRKDVAHKIHELQKNQQEKRITIKPLKKTRPIKLRKNK